jgi:hypothetical protein
MEVPDKVLAPVAGADEGDVRRWIPDPPVKDKATWAGSGTAPPPFRLPENRRAYAPDLQTRLEGAKV